MRMTSAEGPLGGRSYPFSSLSLSRPSASESNLRKISMNASETVPRPGSALGLLQGEMDAVNVCFFLHAYVYI
jgi:hypothetical protein